MWIAYYDLEVCVQPENALLALLAAWTREMIWEMGGIDQCNNGKRDDMRNGWNQSRQHLKRDKEQEDLHYFHQPPELPLVAPGNWIKPFRVSLGSVDKHKGPLLVATNCAIQSQKYFPKQHESECTKISSPWQGSSKRRVLFDELHAQAVSTTWILCLKTTTFTLQHQEILL